MKITAIHRIYIDEIFFYLCTFSSGRKVRLIVKRAKTQPSNGQPQFLTGTHIVIKAVSCKIVSLHPQAVTHENRMVECSPPTPRLQPEQSIREQIFYSIMESNLGFRGESSLPQPPCYLPFPNCKFNRKFNPTTTVQD